MKTEKLPPIKQPLVDAVDAAKAALAKTDHDAERAVELMLFWARADNVLLTALVLHAVRCALPDAGKDRRTKRESAWTAPNYDKGGHGHRLHALAAGNAAMLMDFPLMDGTPLRDATKSVVRANAERYYKYADDMRWKSRWLALIAAQLPEGKTVSAALNEAKLSELQAKAKHGK